MVVAVVVAVMEPVPELVAVMEPVTELVAVMEPVADAEASGVVLAAVAAINTTKPRAAGRRRLILRCVRQRCVNVGTTPPVRYHDQS